MRNPDLVASRKGQIARALAEPRADTKRHVVALGHPDCDIHSGASICATFGGIRPGIVINQTAFGLCRPEWQDSLYTCLQRLIRTEAWTQ